MRSVHGHVISSPSHVIFVGRNSKMRALVVIFRQGHKAYIYKLGESYHPGLCCTLAKHPQPGVFVAKMLRKFPTETID